jgi:hypothetical protein
MASERQLAANRRNAQKSSGPRTPEGKVRASRNALKTGLYAQGIVIGSELGSNLEQLEARFTAEYHPTTPTERSLVDQLIHYEWLLRRFRWVETEVWKVAVKRLGQSEMLNYSPYGYAYSDNPGISRLYRQRASIQKMYRDTLAELRRLRTPDPEPDPEPAAPVPQRVVTKPTSPENGFVPSPSPKPVSSRHSTLYLLPPVSESSLPLDCTRGPYQSRAR